MTVPPSPNIETPIILSKSSAYTQRQIQWRNIGLNRSYLVDIYYYLLATSWRKLFGFAFVSYLLINLLFGMLYFWDLGSINGARPWYFSDAFYFSVQTFSTIGYGAMSPTSLYTHTLVAIEAFIGLVSAALITGIIFAKFSRPTAALRFSEKAVVHNVNGVPHLHLRLANERQSEILNAHVTLSALIEETNNEGMTMRRVNRLPLVRDDIPLFAMAWTLMHPLDESSPLEGLSAKNINDRLLLIIVTIEGAEATFMQTVQTHHFYRPQDIEFERQYKDMILPGADGIMELHHKNLHRTEPFGGWQY